jgi:hypothetical protein
MPIDESADIGLEFPDGSVNTSLDRERDHRRLACRRVAVRRLPLAWIETVRLHSGRTYRGRISLHNSAPDNASSALARNIKLMAI